MSRRGFGVLCLALTAAAASGCAKPRLELPSGPAQPLADAASVLDEAFRHCADLRTISLELGLSGRAGGEKVRGRLLAGLAAPSSIRLEAVAPFGQPAFILAASESRSVLLLPRDDRVLHDAPPEHILEALAGLDVGPGDLLAFLAGCPGAAPRPGSARGFDDSWAAVDLDDGAVAYMRRVDGWHLAAIVRSRLRVMFEQWNGTHPLEVRLQSPTTDDPGSFDLLLRLSQVERNVPLPPEAFTVDVPPDAAPITLDELRRSGPMRDTAPDRTS